MQSAMAPAHGNPASTRRLALGFGLVASLTYGLIVLGALVRAHHAGLACPDWPLCFGRLVPEFNLQIAFEWGHRLFAGSIALMFAFLSVRTLRHPAVRGRLTALLLASAVILIIQIVLGGLTVLHLLASWTVTSHLIAGNAFALCLAFASRTLYEASVVSDDTTRSTVPAALRAAVYATAALLLLQIVLGGLVSSNYAGLACPDWPTCRDGVLAPTFEGRVGLQVLHRFTAYLLVLALAATWAIGRRHAAGPSRFLRRLLPLAAAVGLLQIVVGVANVLLQLPVEVTGAHSLLAAILVLTLGLAVRECARSA